jgi:hypothetical protein
MSPLVLDLVGIFAFGLAGALLCLTLRMMAIHRGWHLSRAKTRTVHVDEP